MSCSSVKALAALKHVTSYLDGTPDSGMLLKVTQEGKATFGEKTTSCKARQNIPEWFAEGRFVLEAYSDSSWAD